MNREQLNTELVTIAVVSQSHKAHMLKAFLEEEGIIVFLQNELSNQLYLSAAGGIKIQTVDMDAEKAHQLLIEGGYI